MNPNKTTTIVAAALLASTAIAAVDTTKPMLTGTGNVDVKRPEKLQVTNQAATPTQEDVVVLNPFTVAGSFAGSLMAQPAAKTPAKPETPKSK